MALCKYLISEGADKTLRADAGQENGTWWGTLINFDHQTSGTTELILLYRSPARMAAYYVDRTTTANMSNTMDILRLFTDDLNFHEDDGDGWTVLDQLSHAFLCNSGDFDAKVSLLLWLIRLSSFDLKGNHAPECYVKTLDAFITNYGLIPVDAINQLLELRPKEAIDARLSPTGYTVLHIKLAEAGEGYRDKEAFSTTFSLRPNLYILGLDHTYSPRQESPMSLAMYSAWVFLEFRSGVKGMGVNIEEFIKLELADNRPLTNDNWETDTLLSLFKFSIPPELFKFHGWLDRDELHNVLNPSSTTFFDCRRRLPDGDCADCGDNVRAQYWTFRVQPYWQYLLDMIRQRKVSELPSARTDDHYRSSNLINLATKPVRSPPEMMTLNNSPHEPFRSMSTTGPFSNHSSQVSPPIGRHGDGSPTTSNMSTSRCMYEIDDFVCIWCWLAFKETGQRYSRRVSKTKSSSHTDDSSSDEFSPYLVHF